MRSNKNADMGGRKVTGTPRVSPHLLHCCTALPPAGRLGNGTWCGQSFLAARFAEKKLKTPDDYSKILNIFLKMHRVVKWLMPHSYLRSALKVRQYFPHILMCVLKETYMQNTHISPLIRAWLLSGKKRAKLHNYINIRCEKKYISRYYEKD